MQPVYLVCGVQGSGKTWVCRKLQNKLHYIPHDEHFTDQAKVVAEAAATAQSPIITECPFGERILRDQMIYDYGLTVIPFFVVNNPELIAAQYLAREGKPLPKAAYTRATSIINRAQEWGAYYGTSEQVFEHIRRL